MIRNVAELYEAQQGPMFERYPARREILAKLKAMDVETVTADEVTAIIGTRGWISMTCNECNNLAGDLVEIGDEPDYESQTARVCKECAPKLIAMLQQL